MRYPLLLYLTTLLWSAMLLLVAVVAGLVTLMLVLAAVGAVMPPWLPVALYGIGAAPGFLLFRILGSHAEARYPELRSLDMRTIRLAPIVGLIVAVLGLLLSAARAPWPVAGIPEGLWVLVGCLGALAGEVALWRRPPVKRHAAVT